MSVEPELILPPELLPEGLRPLAAEVNVYFRELPRLLAEGHQGRYALIHGGRILSVWDTYHDVLQAGYERFGPDGGFLAQPIDRRDVERLAALGLPEDACLFGGV
jgi:hypothetical protein